MCHVSHFKCHTSPSQTDSATDPPLHTPPLCTVGWFTKTKQTQKSRIWDVPKLSSDAVEALILFGFLLPAPKGWYIFFSS